MVVKSSESNSTGAEESIRIMPYDNYTGIFYENWGSVRRIRGSEYKIITYLSIVENPGRNQ